MSEYLLEEYEAAPGSERCWHLSAGSDGPRYSVRALVPAGEAPPAGWPALVLLDGEGLLGTFGEAMARLARRTDATGVRPAVIVALAAEPAPGTDHRRRDFATPRAGEAGGEHCADAFLALIEQGLVPALVGKLGLDPARLALLGHSLAGYFALHALGSPGRPFAQVVALSPSIWWDREGLYRRLGLLAAGTARAFVAVGEWEGAVPPWQSGHPLAEDALARRQARRMVGNVQDMGEFLAGQLGSEAAAMCLFDDEDHASIITRSIAPVLRFLSQGWR